jgi:hypothetical protein
VVELELQVQVVVVEEETQVEVGVVWVYTRQLLQTVLPMVEVDLVVKVQQLQQVVHMVVGGVLEQLVVGMEVVVVD